MSKEIFYWSRVPGQFVNKHTGATFRGVFGDVIIEGPKFTGSVREWYETLTESVIDLRNTLYKQAERKLGKCEVDNVHIKVDPDTMCIVESTILYKPNLRTKTRNSSGTLSGNISVVSNGRRSSELGGEMTAKFKNADGKSVTLKGQIKILGSSNVI